MPGEGGAATNERFMRNMLFAAPVALLVLLALTSFAACASARTIAPYPKSRVIHGIDWDFSIYTSAAEGSDLWYATWCADDHLYASFGDGFRFDNCDQSGPHRASLGIARTEGKPPNWVGRNVWGGVDAVSRQETVRGKASGILCVDRTIYLFATRQDSWDQLRIISFADLGKTGTSVTSTSRSHCRIFRPFSSAKTTLADQNTSIYFFLNGQEDDRTEHLGLARVYRTQIDDRSAYEFFAALDGTQPRWSRDIDDRRLAFSNTGGGIMWGFAAVYHPDTERYLLTVRHNDSSGWGLYDAPNPWGPWTTAAHYESGWKDSERKFTWILTQKWLAPDGQGFWMINSGGPEYEGYHHVRGTFRSGGVP
jgi:hypothetical protein